MTPEQFQRVEGLFHQARDLPPGERGDFLESACGHSPEIRAEVEKLLRHAVTDAQVRATRPGTTAAGRPNGAREEGRGPPKPGPGAVTPSAADRRGTRADRLGPYRLLEVLGKGGFGVVHLAEQTAPIRRRVAIKLIKPGMDSEGVIARFEAERQALAILDHPNVARVIDAGTTDRGRPYFVMEYVPGVPITEYCDRHKLDTAARLDLLIQVCEAAQHAHQKGIIHRDIKPSNILVTVQDDRPVPKVIDFGVAKAISHRLTAETIYTEQGQLIGTPEYMSPEQAEMSGLHVDTRTDIYSLGVLLYELLVGKLPFETDVLRRAGYAEIQRVIREEDPPTPSHRLSTLGGESTAIAGRRRTDAGLLIRQIRGDLDWITMKAMDKDRTRRYGTASELAADIRRHLRHEPVVAGPPSTTYRLKKFARRHRAGVAGATAVLVALLLGIVGTGLGLARATHERNRAIDAERAASDRATEAEAARRNAEAEAAKVLAINEFLQDMLGAASPLALGQEATVRQVLDSAVRELESGALRQQPAVEAAVRTTIGQTYQALGLYDAAGPHLRRAIELRESRPEGNDAEVAISMRNLGQLLYERGELEASESRFREALEMLRTALGAEDPEVLATEVDLAVVREARGDLDGAEALLRRSLAAQRRQLGSNHIEVATTLNNLACLLQHRGDHVATQPLFEEALSIQRQALGVDHVRVVETLNNLAKSLQMAGDLAGAERVLREALPILRRAYQNRYPRVAICLDSLAQVLYARGNLAEAESLYRESLGILRALLPDDHIDLANALNNLGLLLQAKGDWAEAESLLRDALERYTRVLGEDHVQISWSEHNLAMLLQDQGRVSEAEVLFRDALRIVRRQMPQGHPDVASALAGLGGCLLAANRCAEAEPLLRECLSIREAKLTGHWLHYSSLGLAGEAALCLGELDRAERRLLESYKGLSADPITPAPRLREAIERLIRLYTTWDRRADVEHWKTRLQAHTPLTCGPTKRAASGRERSVVIA